jgi:preprotein translocase subunit SecB
MGSSRSVTAIAAILVKHISLCESSSPDPPPKRLSPEVVMDYIKNRLKQTYYSENFKAQLQLWYDLD